MDGSEAVRSDMQVVPEPETVQETASSDTDRLIDAPCVLAEGLVKYGNKQTVRKLVFALLVCLCFMVVEFCGGYFTHSLALMTDAAHLLSDVTGFAVAAVASHLASRKSARTYSFGYHRAEVLGALMSVLIIWVVTGVLIYEAILRIITPGHTKGKAMFFFALGGIAVNFLNFAILGHAPKLKNAVGGHSHHADINLKGAILHVFGDTIQAIGVAIAAALIWAHQNQEKWQIADPICTLTFAVIVFCTTIRMVRDIADIVMERVPRGYSIAKTAHDLAMLAGVDAVHDLHVWTLKPGVVMLTTHVVTTTHKPHLVLHDIEDYCKQHGIHHPTIQIEGQHHSHLSDEHVALIPSHHSTV